MTKIKTEGGLQSYLFRRAKQVGVFCRKVAAVGRRGFPDVMLADDGRVLFVELKSPTGRGRLSSLQEAEIDRMEQHGLDVLVVETKEGVDDALKKITDR